MSLLLAEHLAKSYGGVPVLEGVRFELAAGEVHALMGENGAGKSTLCRILCGMVKPDAGQMQLDSQPHAPRSRREAEEAGVRIVTQEFNLLPTLTVAENIYLEAMPRRWGMIDYRTMNRRAAEAMAGIGLKGVAPDRLVGTLGVGQAQLVEIAAALSKKCRVLVLDEPTAALTSPEIELLFAQVRRLRTAGVGIIYVSHRMEEIRQITDRVTILRDGKMIATHRTSEVSPDEIVRLMVGRDLSTAKVRSQVKLGPVALSVKNLSRGSAVQNVSFEVRRGEILGFAGLMGSGRTETMRAIFAADRAEKGTIEVGGVLKKIRSPRDAVQARMAFLTEDRRSQGLLLPMSIRHNTTLTNMPAVSVGRTVIKKSAEISAAEQWATALATRCRSVEQPAGQLSGGNQQKVVIAKWLFRDSDVLIFDEPTRGIDVGAKFEIYQLLDRLAADGKAIVVVSSDLLELMAISDRIAVMSAGHLAETFDRDAWSQEKIMQAALSRLGVSG